MLKDFMSVFENNTEIRASVNSLKEEVEDFASAFVMPGDC